MQYFNSLSTLSEQKLIYRRLAMLNHPDMGGNPEIMKKINMEYVELKRQFSEKINAFENICVGDIIIINNSTSTIVSASNNTFTAKSEYTQRHAVFSKKTGICIHNPKFKASIPKKISDAY